MIGPSAHYQLSVQHTGTYFGSAAFTACTGMRSHWMPVLDGLGRAHIYGEKFLRKMLDKGALIRKAWDSGQPILTTLVHPQRSLSTFVRRRAELKYGYSADDHMDSLARLAGMIEDPRVFALRVDGPEGERESQLRGMCRHMKVAPVNGALCDFAERWPRINSAGSDILVDHPVVPQKIVVALGYEA